MAACSNCTGPLPNGARFCPNCATPVESAPAATERKLATVLFADLVGSTAFASSRDPEQVRDTLDRFYDAMTAELADRGGVVEKFIGDAVVAVFGAPAAREDHAERALDAALAMQRRFAELFTPERLALRIGVNTGEVVVGRPREGSSFVTGDTANVAARLEQAAAAGEVWVGERTVAAVGAAFEFGDLAIVAAKGKPEGVPARRLLRMLAPTRPRGRLAQTFVGRDRELAWLTAELDGCVRQGRPRFAVVVGDPGVGKTSLVGEFRSRLGRDVGFRLGRCVSFGRGATYAPLADLLRAEPPVVLTGREILAMSFGQPVPGDLDPRVAAERLRTGWADLLTEMATRQTVVLVIEDLHWASTPLLAVLERVLTDAHGPVLVLATTRPEHPALPEGVHELGLDPLSPAEVDALMSGLLGTQLPATAYETIVRQAEGNPFFLEEIVAAFIDHGLLVHGGGGWAWRGEPGGIDIPDSVQALLAARIDLLPAPAKSALQAAAVIGRVVSEAGLNEMEAGEQVGTLVARGFLRSAGDELVFKHALIREVAYRGLPKAKRARLHARFGSWLESRTVGDEQAATLALHYSQAVDPDIAELAWRGQELELHRLSTAALDWLRRAANVAVGGYDIDAALGFLQQAARLAPADPEIWWMAGRANALKYAGQAYWEAMLRAIELTTDPAALAELYSELALESILRGAMWPTPPAPGLLEGWIDKALELASAGSGAQARALLSRSYADDDPQAADAAIAIAERLGDLSLVSYGQFSRWSIETLKADYIAAYDWARRRQAFVSQIIDPDHVANTYQALVAAALAVGRFAEADEHAHRMAAVAERLSAHHAVHVLGTRLSLYEAVGDWAAVRTLQDEVQRAVAANTATPCSYNARLLMSCAVACAEAGADDEAARFEAETDALELESYRMWFDSLRTRLALRRGDLDRVATLVENAESWRWPVFVHCHGVSTHLDALLALGRFDDAAREARRHGQPGGYLEPFALHALGVARSDQAQCEAASARFAALGLPGYGSPAGFTVRQPTSSSAATRPS